VSAVPLLNVSRETFLRGAGLQPAQMFHVKHSRGAGLQPANVSRETFGLEPMPAGRTALPSKTALIPEILHNNGSQMFHVKHCLS